MQDLHTDLAAGVMHAIGHDAVLPCFLLGIHLGRALHDGALRIGSDTARHNQANTACPLRVKRTQALKAIGRLFQPRVHGAHQGPVPELGEPQIQGLHEIGVGIAVRRAAGHGDLLIPNRPQVTHLAPVLQYDEVALNYF